MTRPSGSDPTEAEGVGTPGETDAHAAVLRRLIHITFDRALDLSVKLSSLLRTGRDHLGLEIGILGRVEGDRFEVVAAEGSEGTIEEGSAHELGGTCPEVTLRADAPVAVDRAAPTEGEVHAYRRTPVRSYLGAPVTVGGSVYGTLDFSSTVPRGRPFSQSERDLVGLMASWIGGEIERSRAEEALRESKARFAGILAMAVDAIISVDERQRIVLFNRGAEDIFGYSSEEVLGRPLDLLLPERVRSVHRRHVEEFGRSPVQSRRMGERQEISGLRRSGEEFPAEASISHLEVKGERFFTVILQDITDRKQAEDDLRRYAHELARSNADLEQFAYVASHDLQEPLRMVASYTQLLARRYKGRLDADADEFIGYAVDGVNRMRALINDLLAYSRVGRDGGEFEETDMGTLVDEVIKDLEFTLEEAGARVTRDELPTVEGDRFQLAQLLQNLVENAVRFRGADSPRVHISAEQADGVWRFSVRDNGIGIDPEHAERIFVIFQRLHSRREYPGTGIGLAIAKKIVERHRGTIWVESEPGRGSTFFFTIPAESRA